MAGGPPGSMAYASEILGFLSFAFTLATALRIFWSNLQTLGNAPGEVRNYLATLKQELIEEREHLRRARQRERNELRSTGLIGSREFGGRQLSRHGRRPKLARSVTNADEGKPTILMHDTMRALWKRFRALERPFLSPRRRRSSRDDVDFDAEKMRDADEDDYYCHSMDLGKRILWTFKKAEAKDLANALLKLQTRRISRETTDILGWVDTSGTASLITAPS
ncbi:MAG: hypothetical protein M1814_001408 [Vezdaea aestivalis]|nr:MAG: hypothetical protein M1814_001408 [Vezdaea aestivalis]